MPHHGLARSLWPGSAGYVFARYPRRLTPLDMPFVPAATRALWVPDVGGKVRDVTGSGFDGTIVNPGSGTYIDRDFSVGSLLKNTSTTGYVDFGTVTADGDSFTMIMLVQPSTTAADWISRGGGTANYSVNIGAGGTTVNYTIVNSAGASFQVTTTINITNGTWYHLAMVVDWSGLTLTGYTNGVSTGALAITGTALRAATTGWRWLFTHQNAANTFAAAVAYGSLRNKALTASQVQQDYDFSKRMFAPLLQ
jgi:hypothetical protein